MIHYIMKCSIKHRRMVYILKTLILAMGIYTVTIVHAFASITSYMPYYALYTESLQNGQQTKYIILRKFKHNATVSYLFVNPYNLQTGIIKNTKGHIVKDSLQNIMSQCKDSTYCMLYSQAQQKSQRIFNAGITHINCAGTIITFDLCPSKKPIESSFLEELIARNTSNNPIPITICISGMWIAAHQEDLLWLKELESNHQLSITWVNHSFTHFYSRKLPIPKNFMLKEGTNVGREVLQNEICMLEHNIMPSIFFRFPGLISNQRIYEKVMSYGLIPLGADAWLAKGKMPKRGSIILIHPNGNEKKGTKLLLHYIKTGIININTIVSLKESTNHTTYTAYTKKKDKVL